MIRNFGFKRLGRDPWERWRPAGLLTPFFLFCGEGGKAKLVGRRDAGAPRGSRTGVLELDRDPAEDAAADAVGLAGVGGEVAAPAQLHVELHGPVGGEAEEDVEVLVH